MEQPGEKFGEIPNFDDVNKIFVWSIIGVFVLAIAGIAASFCFAAPAPLPRPVKTPKSDPIRDVAGVWTFTWAGDPLGVLWLKCDGTVEEYWNGLVFTGTWRLDSHYIEIETRSANHIYEWGRIKLIRKNGVLIGDKWSMMKR